MTTRHLYDPPYALWTIWRSLSTLNRGLIVILGVVFVYCVFSTIRTMLRLHSVWNRSNQDRQTVSDTIAALAARYARMRQVISATFYLFGLVLFLGLENIPNVLADGKEPLGVYVLDNFLLLCAFAANVFFIFLVLHSIQWAGSAVLDSLSRRVSSRA
jgi:hypothetical protein